MQSGKQASDWCSYLRNDVLGKAVVITVDIAYNGIKNGDECNGCAEKGRDLYDR